MTPELQDAINMAKAARPRLSQYLFCTSEGKCYIDGDTEESRGWQSMWARFMARVLSETKVKERFTEHDLRAKAASGADSLEHARALLSHTDSKTTRAVYRRKPERVDPLSKSS